MNIEPLDILTEEEVFDLFSLSDDNDPTKPTFFDGNEDEWIAWLYSKGYRVVLLRR